MEKFGKEYLELLYRKISGDCYKSLKAVNISADFYDMLPNKFASKSLGKILKEDKVEECLPLYGLMFVRSVKDSELVYGSLKKVCLEKNDEAMKHVWVNLGSFVVDFKTRYIYYKDEFYKAFDAQENVVFKREQLLDADNFAKLVNESVKDKPELQPFAKKVIASNDHYTERYYEI